WWRPYNSFMGEARSCTGFSPAVHWAATLFDLDGVLVDSQLAVERAWRRWAAEEGVPVDNVLAVVHGRPSRDGVRSFAPAVDVDEHVLRLGGYESDEAHTLAAVPGADACVEVARRGAWAIVTSGRHELATARLRTVGLPVPPVLVTADDVTRGKPDPEP